MIMNSRNKEKTLKGFTEKKSLFKKNLKNQNEFRFLKKDLGI